jgi:hypothetical protein
VAVIIQASRVVDLPLFLLGFLARTAEQVCTGKPHDLVFVTDKPVSATYVYVPIGIAAVRAKPKTSVGLFGCCFGHR